MKKIATTEIADGMVLAKPLFGPGGAVLLGPGTELRTSLVPRLLSWGIHGVVVEGEDSSSEGTPIDNAAKVEAIRTLFEGRLDHPGMRLLMDAVIDIRSVSNG